MIKLGDFGLAVQLEHLCPERQTQAGTWLYMAPEVYDGKAEMKSDVWALGISLIEMAEGKNPFDGCSSVAVMRKVCDGQPPSLSSSTWSDGFVDFVSKCLVKDAKERWNVDQLMEVHVVMDDDA